ncbi:hypothetical protein D3C81_1888910 [compost metagenome]
MIILRLHAVIGLAEAPVREPGRHAVSADGVEHLGRAHLIPHGEEVESVFKRQPSQMLYGLLQLPGLIVGHRAVPPLR